MFSFRVWEYGSESFKSLLQKSLRQLNESFVEFCLFSMCVKMNIKYLCQMMVQQILKMPTELPIGMINLGGLLDW